MGGQLLCCEFSLSECSISHGCLILLRLKGGCVGVLGWLRGGRGEREGGGKGSGGLFECLFLYVVHMHGNFNFYF